MEENQPVVQELEPQGPLVSIVIVTYRQKALLKRCLDAVQRSEQRARMQVIVLDPGSHDTTAEWDLDYPDVEFLRLPRNFGATKALNIGIRSAKAELLLFLDPAVEVEPGTIAGLVGRHEEEAGALCPLLVDGAGKAVAQVGRLPERDLLWKLWQDPGAMVRSVPGSVETAIAVEYPGRKALLIKRAFLKGMNYFDEGYGEWGADLELAFQVRHAGKKILILPEYRGRDHSEAAVVIGYSSGQMATLAGDRLNGVAHFLGKRLGFVTELLIRVQAVLVTVLRMLTLQKPGYQANLLASLLSGQKIDGTQGW